MRGNNLLEHIGVMYTMLYFGMDLVGFFTTNQEAWLYLVAREDGETPPLASVVAVILSPKNDNEIEIASIQTFRRATEEDFPAYVGFHLLPENKAAFEEKIRKDWKESVTK